MLLPTLLIGLVVVITMIVAFDGSRDTFHPAMLIAPMLGFHYCYSPLILESSEGFYGYLFDEHVEFAQWVHVAGVLALCLGLLATTRATLSETQIASSMMGAFDRRTIIRGSIVLGAMGLLSWGYTIAFVGGLHVAYGRAYGGGYASSGWVRDLVLYCFSALLLMAIGQQSKRFSRRELLLVIAFAGPFLIHGLLGARRGPTFMGFAGPVMVYYMARGSRPRFLTLAVGGACLGIFLLALVANRSSVYWGSELELKEGPSKYFQPSAGNDFIYAAGLVVVANEVQNFGWGSTYLTTLLVRPIPRALWPTKYEDAARFFGQPSLDDNFGVDILAYQSILGWTAARGAAPGIVGDMWREFSWLMLIVLYGIGWSYSHAWRRAVSGQSMWIPVYCYMASVSIYLVMQSLQAMLYRFLFGVVPMIIVLRLARRSRAAVPELPAPAPGRNMRPATPIAGT